jgi:hypothetical protein
MCSAVAVPTDIEHTSDGPTISSGASRGIMRGQGRGRRAAASGSCCTRSATTRAKKR